MLANYMIIIYIWILSRYLMLLRKFCKPFGDTGMPLLHTPMHVIRVLQLRFFIKLHKRVMCATDFCIFYVNLTELSQFG